MQELQSKKWLIIGATLLFLAISLGAFGSHGLQKIVSPEAIKSFQIGVTYQFYHSISILTLLGVQRFLAVTFLRYAFRSMLAGVICFSGSLYTLTFLKAFHNATTLPNSLFVQMNIILTPLGGVFFLLAWLFVLLGAIKKRA